jgi:hypothetical protein
MPTASPAPMDAALGDLIRDMTGRFRRPAHLHFAIETKFADALANHIFVRGSGHIDCAARLRRASGLDHWFHRACTRLAAGRARDERRLSHAEYDFVMTRSGR